MTSGLRAACQEGPSHSDLEENKYKGMSQQVWPIPGIERQLKEREMCGARVGTVREKSGRQKNQILSDLVDLMTVNWDVIMSALSKTGSH